MNDTKLLEVAESYGLEVNHSRFCGNVTAYVLGCNEVLQGWESLEELFTWAWHKTNDGRFLDLADESEELIDA